MLSMLGSVANQGPSIPGPNSLVAGDVSAGYYGQVSYNDLISGDALASLLGITEGFSQFSTSGWLKFSYAGKTIFVAKTTFRYKLSWNTLNYNTVGDIRYKYIFIDGIKYKCRLIWLDEWKALFYGVLASRPPNWGINFQPADIHSGRNYLTNENGCITWCSDRVNSPGSSNAVITGSYYDWDNNVSHVSRDYTTLGWRPVLEVVE